MQNVFFSLFVSVFGLTSLLYGLENHVFYSPSSSFSDCSLDSSSEEFNAIECVFYEKRCFQLKTSVDFLYWQLRSDGLVYAYTGDNANTPDVTTFSRARSVHPGFEPGVSIRADFSSLDCNSWTFGVQYTYFHSGETNTADAPGTIVNNRNIAGPFLLPVFMNSAAAPNAQSAKATDTLDLHMLDIYFGKNCYWGNCLMINPHLGVKGIYIKQDLDVDYFGVLLAGPDFDVVNCHNDIDNHAIGLMVGLDVEWKVWRCLRLLANASMGSLWTSSSYEENETNSTLGQRSFISASTDSFIPVYEVFIGCALGELSFKCFLIDLQVGWKHLIFSDLMQWRRWGNFSDPVLLLPESSGDAYADIAFAGVVARASIRF